MPMTATMAPYTLFILDDDTPMNPREDHDCLGKWSAGTADTAWARNMIMTSQAISCEACCFLNTPAAMTGTIRFLHFSNLARPKMPDWNTTAPRGSGNCGRISTGVQTAIGMCPPAMPPR